ncbi:MAG TPA: DUF3501 family protein [Acidimicrobiales bacterium]|nr:DUF3501 family protein [Acidimicrobiales bacterium]
MKLTLDDIADLRAYERERETFRTRIIELKKLRRVHVGPVVTLVFENRDTMRFQIQEMARAERLLTDAAIQAELDAYNPLIPDPGQLSATLFIELTTKDEMTEWLPKLVGIERSVVISAGGEQARPAVQVRGVPEEAHAAQLTREEVTASVHYVRFVFDAPAVDAFSSGPAWVSLDHPAYAGTTELSGPTRASLMEDLRPAG